MKVLIAPMGAMAPTNGPFTRTEALSKALLDAGHDVVLCAARDVNYHPIDGVFNYESPIPSPLGLPKALGIPFIKIVQKIGLQEKADVKSFEQVLFFTGTLNAGFFKKDVECLRKAISTYKPDLVYAEFRIAALVAAKLEKVKSMTGYSYPVQTSFASSPEFAGGVKKVLKEYGLPEINSVLEIFDWAELKIVPSSYDLEPINDSSVIFTGPFSKSCLKQTMPEKRKKIIAYFGTGTISGKKVVETLTEAFYDTDTEVYISTSQVKAFQNKNIFVDKQFDFSELMPQAVVYLNHGGQNSIMTGLSYGVPQIICPGNVFERQYNAASIQNLKAGLAITAEMFNPKQIRAMLEKFKSDQTFQINAQLAGEKLLELGGVRKAVEAMEMFCNVAGARRDL